MLSRKLSYKFVLFLMLIIPVINVSGADMKVMVRDRDGGEKLEGVEVLLTNTSPVMVDDVLDIGTFKRTLVTDADGNAVFEDIPQAAYSVTVKKKGYEVRDTTKEVKSDSEVMSLRIKKKEFGFRIPLGDAIENFIEAIKGGRTVRSAGGKSRMTWGLSRITLPLSDSVENGIASIVTLILYIPIWLMIILITVGTWFLGRWKLSIFTFLGLALIWNLGLWPEMINTIVLVLISTLIAILVGVPFGILGALSDSFHRVITPILDFMQTMPAFVYLIPAVPFFGITSVSAIVAIVIFAIPPAIRLTSLGIRQIPPDLIEAADAFGSTGGQKLLKLQLPLALPTIMAGINQTIMLALSMVVIASMIGAKGLGVKVLTAIQELQLGMGFEAGIAVVIIAMLLDRITQKMAEKA